MEHGCFRASEPPRVSVVIVNWNRAELLRACLDSLCAGQGAGFETIVVDNGSGDGSCELVERLRPALPYPVRLIRNSANLGFCAANNQGIEAARGEFVALLNNDAEAAPGWLGALLTAFEDPAVGMAASKVLVYQDPRVIDKVGHLIYLDGQNRGRGTGQIDAGQFDRVEEVLWPDGCACMYRKAMLDRSGGFDEDLFAYADDAELGLRARIAGWNCLYIPTAVVRHHRGSTLGKQNPRRVTLIERNRVLLAAKLFPGTLLWRNVAYYVARLAAGLWAAMLNRGEISRFQSPGGKMAVLWAMARGDWEALLLLPRMLRKRRQMRSLRKLSPRQVKQLLLRHRISLKELSQGVAQRP
ncbi:MAG: glycosyltransferase family 2 protein [Acidobacteria bacterium]|nr:glycosyltransferase family 2 protein [Acidobacteriota bacterium]